MKCIQCNTEFEAIFEKRKHTVDCKNPGIVEFEGKACECPKCKTKSTNEEDILDTLTAFEEAYAKMH